MSMVGGLDLHRRQITYDVVDVETGESWRGRLWQPDRGRFRHWLQVEVSKRAGDGTVALAVEGCTGWRYVVEEISAAGSTPFLAEPADTQAARGRKRRAKTDRTDAALLRELLQEGDLPESWIPPDAVLEWRERVRLYKSLVDQRTLWCQRIHAVLYHHGVAMPEGAIRTRTRPVRRWPAASSSSRVRRASASTPPTRWSTPPMPRRCRSSTSSSVSAHASRRAKPSSTPNTGSGGCSRSCSGPSSATADASRAPSRWCATAVST